MTESSGRRFEVGASLKIKFAGISARFKIVLRRKTQEYVDPKADDVNGARSLRSEEPLQM